MTWNPVPIETTRLYSPIGLRLLDELTNQPPLGKVQAILDILDTNGNWQQTRVQAVFTPSAVLSYPGLGRQTTVAGRQAQRCRVRLIADLYVPYYLQTADGIAFNVYPYNDDNPPAVVSGSAVDTQLLPAPNYPFPAPMPEETMKPVKSIGRDFSNFKPASDDVFHAYQLLYAYPNTPLRTTTDGVIQETADWREEKVTFDTGYRGQRMSAYLFLPKNVHPPYQTVLFFPSARVMFIPDNKGGRNLGDTQFFDYIVQSGRAVIYPIYEDTYERRVKYSLPSGAQQLELTTDWYKDAARSLDYLATRPDIDSNKLAYLGVSMGSAQGVITSSLMQNRIKTAILLDGGFFLETPPAGGDQADFAPRMRRPVLMVNGRYDFTFPVEKAQNPLFAMLGTPEEDKRHLILETPHDVTEQRTQLTKAVLDWLDHYLGRVNY
jgi:dienelactone hydrolase